MGFAFPPDATKIIVPVYVVGPRQGLSLDCTLDIGSERTVLPQMFLRRLGLDLSHPAGWTTLRTAIGVARVPLIRVPAITALDRVRTDLLVAAHDMPYGVETDGLLGLDFFRSFILTLDFTRGRITLVPRRWWRFWS